MAQISNLSPLSGSRGPVPLNEVAVLLHPDDDVVIAKSPLLPKTTLLREDADDIVVARMIPPGHKVATRHVAEGQPVRRYGQIIGFATTDIAPGDHVHTQNIAVHQGELELDYAFGADVKPVDYVPEDQRRTFMGFRRPDGRVGTRNYVAVIVS